MYAETRRKPSGGIFYPPFYLSDTELSLTEIYYYWLTDLQSMKVMIVLNKSKGGIFHPSPCTVKTYHQTADINKRVEYSSL